MKPEETKALDALTKEISDLKTTSKVFSDKLLSKEEMVELTKACRLLHTQRAKVLWTILLFAGFTLGWLIAISVFPCIRPKSWLDFAVTITPALVWLGVGALVIRPLRQIR